MAGVFLFDVGFYKKGCTIPARAVILYHVINFVIHRKIFLMRQTYQISDRNESEEEEKEDRIECFVSGTMMDLGDEI